MLRKITAAVVLVLCLGVAMADEMFGRITKVEGDKVTVKSKDGGEQTLTAAATVKVVKGKFNKETKKIEDPTDVEEGLKHKMFSNVPEKGIPAVIVTNDDKKITEIRVFGGKKK
jgi:phosphate-selective porin